jgi:hypothetical protein
MRQKSVPRPATEVAKKIRRATPRHFAAEDAGSGLGALWPVTLTQAYARAAAILRYKLSAARL